MKKGKRKVTKKIHNEIKKLKDMGLTGSQISKIVGLNDSTISRVLNSNDVDDYYEKAKIFREKNNEKPAEEVSTSPPSPISDTENDLIILILSMVESTNKNFKIISALVDKVEELEGQQIVTRESVKKLSESISIHHDYINSLVEKKGSKKGFWD